MKNCVFVCPEIEKTTVTYHYSYGSLFTYDYDMKNNGNTGLSTQDIYVISPYCLGAWSNNKAGVNYAFDCEEIDFTATNKYQITGVTRYEDEQDMIDAGNVYTEFVKSGYWELDSNGLPVWKN